MQFILDDKDMEKLKIWKDQMNLRAIEKQKQTIGEDHPSYSVYLRSWNMGQAYGGAIGGSLTYMFTPTTVNCIVTVRHSSGEELDLTDSDW